MQHLGVGGQADVWLAEDLELGERVAVKVFRSELSEVARERLRREVRLGRSLQHPHLVRVYELIETDGGLAAAMEWVEGGSVVGPGRFEPLAIDRVVEVGTQVLGALAYLHRGGVVHRDVKPSNLLVDGEGRVRLGDLGLARSLETDHTVTRTHFAVGTTRYMSPEQVRGERAVPASDLYGLGVTLYELLTGRPPYESPSEFELARLHLQAPLPNPRQLRPECPRWLAGFVMRLMEKRPEDRFADGAAALAAFERQRVARSPRLRRRAAFGAAAVAVLAVVVWGGVVAAGHLQRGRTARVEAVGGVVHGLDERGRETWRLGLSEPIIQTAAADVDGGGVPATVVVTALARGTDGRRGSSEILVVRRDGSLVTRAHMADLVPEWPFECSKELAARVRVADLDGDGRSELLVVGTHATFYPAALAAFWPSSGTWQSILYHPGRIALVEPLPGSSPLRVRFAAVNNRLAMLPVVGQLVVHPPREAASRGGGVVREPGDEGQLVEGAADWDWYALLPEGREVTSFTVDGDRGSTVVVSGVARRVDGFGNAVGGPNEGMDLHRERQRFFRALRSLGEGQQPLSAAGVQARIDETRESAPRLLRERPYDAVLALYGARALARVGDSAAAIEMLTRVCRDTPYDDLVFRLANLHATVGELEAAQRELGTLLDDAKTYRHYDALQLQLRLAIARRDSRSADLAMQALTGLIEGWNQKREGTSSSLRARVHLWTDAVTEADSLVRSWEYAPAGEAIACLARWRLGRTEAGDVEAMKRFIDRNPDAVWEGRVALGAALLGSGRPREAAASLGTTIAGLEPLSRDDFMNRQVLDLARALHAEALDAAAERTRALVEARGLRPTLRDGLLPANLVDEVLAKRP